MSQPTSDNHSPPPDSALGDDATADATQSCSNTPEVPVEDKFSTPTKSSGNATRNLPNPPQHKEIRPVHTGLDAMYNNLVEVEIETFFKDYLPGLDPPEGVLDKFYYDSAVDKVKKEWELGPIICRMAHSVASYARVGPSIVTRDIANWQVSDSDDVENVRKQRVGPDVGVYLDNDRTKAHVMIEPAQFLKETTMKSTEDKEKRKDFVGRRAWGDLVVAFEAKINHTNSAFEFLGKDFTRDKHDGGREALGQVSHYIAEILAHQHRTHLFSVYVFRNKARLLYFDRVGGVVSKSFVYGTREANTLHKFLWRIARMSHEELGFDPTATLASDAHIGKMMEYAKTASSWLKEQMYHALSWDPEANGGRGQSTSCQWPMYHVVVGERELLIGRPKYATPSLFGRCTRGYIAYDVEAEKPRFLKDSWRVKRDKVRPEHEVYKKLENVNVKYIPTCVCGEDVRNSGGEVQETRTQELLSENVPTRVHYRLVVEEVCRPLKDFRNFQELCEMIGDAMYGHQDAWRKAGVLHRDVSVNNILIFETYGDGGQINREGLLSDWDLCKYKEDMVTGKEPRQPDRTGTWYFRSAAILRWPRKPYALSDDIESFVHVFHYCVLRFHPTNQTDKLVHFIHDTYGFVMVRASDGAHIGSEGKLDIMRSAEPMIKPVVDSNETLLTILSLIAKLCADHYATIDEGEYNKLYLAPRSAMPKMIAQPHNGRDVKRKKTDLPSDKAPDLTSMSTGARKNGTPTLADHGALLAIFLLYGEGLGENEAAPWPSSDLVKSETDLFKQVQLDAWKDNYFSSRPSEDSGQNDSRAAKRRKGNDGSALERIVESTDTE